jgi:hypothetical protein
MGACCLKRNRKNDNCTEWFHDQLTLIGSGASASGGATSDVAWNGTDPDASQIAILKAMYAQNETIIGLLGDIKTNTAPA